MAMMLPATLDWWDSRLLKKYRRNVAAYNKLGIRLPESDRILRFIDDNASYLRNRPNRFQHDDFHVANIIVNNGSYAGVIDFNRCDWGDPIHDFLKVGFFSRQVSIPFSIGQIQGYFQESVPDAFWKLYSVYVAMSTIASVVWTMNVVPNNMKSMTKRIEQVLEDHKYFELEKPAWYTE